MHFDQLMVQVEHPTLSGDDTLGSSNIIAIDMHKRHARVEILYRRSFGTWDNIFIDSALRVSVSRPILAGNHSKIPALTKILVKQKARNRRIFTRDSHQNSSNRMRQLKTLDYRQPYRDPSFV